MGHLGWPHSRICYGLQDASCALRVARTASLIHHCFSKSDIQPLDAGKIISKNQKSTASAEEYAPLRKHHKTERPRRMVPQNDPNNDSLGSKISGGIPDFSV